MQRRLSKNNDEGNSRMQVFIIYYSFIFIYFLNKEYDKGLLKPKVPKSRKAVKNK